MISHKKDYHNNRNNENNYNNYTKMNSCNNDITNDNIVEPFCL